MPDTAIHPTHPFSALRELLNDLRETRDVEKIHTALIEITEGLISHAEKQARLLEDLQSDLGHKQGIVTKIGGGDFDSEQDNHRS